MLLGPTLSRNIDRGSIMRQWRSVSNSLLLCCVIFGLAMLTGCHGREVRAWKTNEAVFVRTGYGYWIAAFDINFFTRLLQADQTSSDGTYYVAYMGYTNERGAGAFLEGNFEISQSPICLVMTQGRNAEVRIHHFVIYSRQSRVAAFLEINPTQRLVRYKTAKVPDAYIERDGPKGTLFLEKEGEPWRTYPGK